MRRKHQKLLKIRYLSDLHLEFLDEPPQRLQSVGEDVVILAGDIHVGTAGIEWARRAIRGRPVLYVLGNHEYYHQQWSDLIDRARLAAQGSDVRVLERDAAFVEGIRFLGCTLWTDFQLYGAVSSLAAMGQAGRSLSDYRYIRNGHRLLHPTDTVAGHKASVAWLEKELAMEVPTVVITHHAPSEVTCPPQYRGDALSPAYYSRLENLVASPVITWVHGHTHFSTRKRLGGVPVVVNTRGYSDEDKNFRWDASFEVACEAKKGRR